jgi:hypothetical protein
MFVVEVMSSCVTTKQKREKSQRDEISVRCLNNKMSLQLFLVVILHISRDILLHMFASRLENLPYTVIFQTAKETFYYRIILACLHITHRGVYTEAL